MSKEVGELVRINLNKPKNLVLEDLIKSGKQEFSPVRRSDGTSSWQLVDGKKLTKSIPAMYYFVHILLERRYSNFDTLRLKYDKTFIKMFSRDIEPIKSKNYFYLIWKTLFNYAIVEYQPVSEPNKYRNSAVGHYFKLSEIYSEEKIVQQEVLIKKSIAEKLDKKMGKWKKAEKDEIDLSTITSNRQILHQYQALGNVIFEVKEAKKFADELLRENKIGKDRYNTCLIYISFLENKRIKTTYSDVCKRFFTPINGMPKELRQFILDREGNSLVELDFGSSTAYVIFKILSSNIAELSSEPEKILFDNELDLYARLLKSGDFYSAFKKIVFPDKEIDRDQIKNIVIEHWFNAKPNSGNSYRRRILKHFPKLSGVIDNMKSPKYGDFFNFVMTLESILVNDIIYKKLVDLYPDAIIYTIFDSYLIEQKYSTQLYEMMLQEGKTYYNIDCVVKKK